MDLPAETEQRIRKLEAEIQDLEREKDERERALPAHSIRPHQLQFIEALEEQICRKREELSLLQEGR